MGQHAEVNVGFGTVSNAKDEWLDTYIHELWDLAKELGLTIEYVGHVEFSGVFIGVAERTSSNTWNEIRLDIPEMLRAAIWTDKKSLAEDINTLIRAAYEFVPHEERCYAKLEDELVTASDVGWYAFPSYG